MNLNLKIHFLSAWELFVSSLFLLPIILIPALFGWNQDFANTNTIVIKDTLLQISTIMLILFLPFAWLHSHFAGYDFSRHIIPFLVLLLLLAIYLLLSWQLNFSHPRGEQEFYRWFTYILFSFLCMFYISFPGMFDLFISGTVLTASGISLYALVQALGIDFFTWDLFQFEQQVFVRRVVGSLGNPDFLAGYLAGVLPLTFICLLVYRGWARGMLLTGFIVQIIALLLSYSRGGWLATGVTFVILLSLFSYINWYKKPVLVRFHVKSVHLVFTALFIVLMISGLTWFLWEQMMMVLLRLSQFSEGTSVFTRYYFYQGAFDMWLDRPIFGFGPGSFGYYFPFYRDPELSRKLPFNYWNLDHAHNEFLEIAAETGIVGLILFAGIISYTFLILWKTLRTYRSRENLILLGLLTGMVALLIHNLFTVTLRYTPSAFLLWSYVGVSIGVVRFHEMKKSSISIVIFLVLCLVSLPFLTQKAITNYVGDVDTHKGMAAMNHVDWEKGSLQYTEAVETSLYYLNRGIELAPYLYEPYNYMSVVYGWCLDYPQQQRVLKELAAMNPYFTNVNTNLCVSCLLQAEQIAKLRSTDPASRAFDLLAVRKVEEALGWIEKAIQNDPYEPDHYHKQARCYMAIHQLDKAAEAYQKVITNARYRYDKENVQEVMRQVEEAEKFLEKFQKDRL
ncbi:MAG: O-antigen ligase family protein [bacterium]|jgi:O-antigen ligase